MALTKLKQSLIDGNLVTSVNGNTGSVTVETGIDWQSAIKTSNFTAAAGKGYFVNTTSSEITVTLPAGVVGAEIAIQDYAGTFATNKVSFVANGTEKIQGSTTDRKSTTNNARVLLVYQDATKGWTADNVAADLPPLTVHYLVVGGGGGGGVGSGGGGGGAGGYKTNYGGTALTLNTGTNYGVTVGAGGIGIPQGSAVSVHGYDGNDSVFHSITSLGGGGGGSEGSGQRNGNSGASGGGACYTGTGGSGTSGQGNGGGNGGTPSNYSGGGGGGSSAAGGNASGSGTAGNGGAGTSNSITGSAVTYAGGGGGSSQEGGGPGTRGTGGAGGGGNGAAYNSSAGSAGTANTGGGGGGGAYAYTGSSAVGASFAGGSGVVILRYPSGYTITGLAGTTTTVGNDKVTSFYSGTGNIQFN